VLLPKNRMLSIPHLIVIFIVALVVFGPEKLPELARNLGKVMADFKRATGDFRSTFEDHLRDLERETTDRKIGGGATPVATNAPPALAPPAAQIADNSTEAAALPSAPGSVTANEPYLSRTSTRPPDHALEDDPKISPEVQSEIQTEVHADVPPESSSSTVSNGRKRPG
jgi:sec-independent protein translocase protein TatB